MEEEEYSYKICFLGDIGVGAKTSLFNRIIDNEFHENIPSTSGANYGDIFIQINLGMIKLCLWDTAGQVRFRSLIRHFIRDSHCIILGYDITCKDSFNNIKQFWYSYAKSNVECEPFFYLIANKIDLIEKVEVSEKEAKDYAKQIGSKYFRVSAKTAEGVNELLEDIVNSLIRKFKKN